MESWGQHAAVLDDSSRQKKARLHASKPQRDNQKGNRAEAALYPKTKSRMCFL